MIKMLSNLSRESTISFGFSCAVLLLFLLFPMDKMLEAIIGLIVFFYIMPYLYVRLVLKKNKERIFGMYGTVPSPQLSIMAAMSLSFGIALAYLFTTFSIATIYRDDLIEFLRTDNILAILFLDLVVLLPLFFFMSTFALGFISYLTKKLPDALRNLISWVIFFIIFGFVMFEFMPETSLWFLLPIGVPVFFHLFFYRVGMLYIVPIFMVMIKITFDLLVIT